MRAAAALAALALLGCRHAPDAPPPVIAQPAALAAMLDAHLTAKAPSGTYLFAVGDRVIFHKSYGALDAKGTPIPRDVVMPIGSISKQFTAAAILHLAARRRLSLDAPLSRFFPDAPADKRAITVQQLLGHNAGLARNAGPFDVVRTREQARALIFAAPLLHQPGRHHLYSNAGYMLLAQIVEVASGEPFDAYLARHLFKPAGLTRTGFPGPRFAGASIPEGFDRPKWSEVYSGTPLQEPHALQGWYQRGAGGLLSTAEDLLRWERALRDGRVLPRRWAEQMWTPHGMITADGRYRYGYAFVIQDSRVGPMHWHNGVWYSYYTEVRVFPRTGVVAIGFTNRQQEERFDDAFVAATRMVNDAVVGATPPASAPPPAS